MSVSVIAKVEPVQIADRSQRAEAEIADRLNNFMQNFYKTKQILIVLFLLCFVFIINSTAQPADIQRQIGRAQSAFDNGNYTNAIEFATLAVEKAKKAGVNLFIAKGLDIIAVSNISLEKYEEAEISLDQALKIIADNKLNSEQKAEIYLRFAWLWRSQREFTKALNFSKKAIAELPENRQIQAEHFLNIGRILYASGYDISAIIWLEKAERLLEKEKVSPAKLDVYRFLTRAWWSKLYYQKSLYYAGKWITSAENTQFKYKHRQALLETSTILSETGQKNAALRTMKRGLELALENNNSYQSGIFLTSLLLNSLNDKEVTKASAFLAQLEQLEQLNKNEQFTFEIKLGKAIIFALTDQREKSDLLFSELEKMENTSDFILPNWKIKIAAKNKDWQQLISLNQKYLDLTLKNNFKDELPAIHYNFAQSYFYLNQMELSLEHLKKSLIYIEEVRLSENNQLSLGILETYHKAYRLLTQIRSEKHQESFELADFTKARLLTDKIENSSLKTLPEIPSSIRLKLEGLSAQYAEDQSNAPEINKTERSITTKVSELNLSKPDLSELEKFPDLNDTAIVSYFFTVDKKLTAYVWEKGKPIEIIYLPVSEDEVEIYAKTTGQKIKDLIFFKKDGKELYDKLLKPLNISANHLIIAPDKSLWKIPFQALSPDGEKYLIEEKLISYALSVSILLDQLKNQKPDRHSLQAFANSTYENRFLQYADTEAKSVAEIYNSQPLLNATIADFKQNSAKADILHFSIHAQVDNEQPLDSFLGFKKFGKESGRLTVEDILDIKLKKGSLVFLASCDTDNVLSGSGHKQSVVVTSAEAHVGNLLSVHLEFLVQLSVLIEP